MKKVLAGIIVVCFVFSLFSVIAPNAKGMAESINSPTDTKSLSSLNATSTRQSSPPYIGNSTKILQAEPGLPPNQVVPKQINEIVSTPVVERQADGSFVVVSPLTDCHHWWLIDYWAQNPSSLPTRMSGTFQAVSNTIGNMAQGDTVLYLPLNVAYGSSTSNFVWYQFSIQFNYGNTISWYIWDIQNGQNFHYYNIPLSYIVGDYYNFNMTTSGQSTVTFTVQDMNRTGSSSYYSNSTWAYTPPSLNMQYLYAGPFAPASAVEGYTTNSQLTNVPYFQTYVGDSLPTHWYGTSTNSSIPSGIATKTYGGPGNYYWAMETDTNYYVSSVYSYQAYGSGYVSNPTGLIGNGQDFSYAYFYGGNPGDGGQIIGNLNTVAGDRIAVWGYSAYGYTSTLYVYVSWDASTWYQIGQPISISSTIPMLYVAGSINREFKYVAVVGYDGNGNSVSLYADFVAAG